MLLGRVKEFVVVLVLLPFIMSCSSESEDESPSPEQPPVVSTPNQPASPLAPPQTSQPLSVTVSISNIAVFTGGSQSIDIDSGNVSLSDLEIELSRAPETGNVEIDSTNGVVTYSAGQQTGQGQFSLLFSANEQTQEINITYTVNAVATLPPPASPLNVTAETTQIRVAPEKSQIISVDISPANMSDLQIALTNEPEIGQVTFDTLTRSIIFIADTRTGQGEFTIEFELDGQSRAITFDYEIAEQTTPPVTPPAAPAAFEVSVASQNISLYESSSQAIPLSFGEVNAADVSVDLLLAPAIGQVAFNASTNAIVFSSTDETGTGEFRYRFSHEQQIHTLTFNYQIFENDDQLTEPNIELNVSAATTNINAETSQSKVIAIDIGEATMSDITVSLLSAPLHGRAIFDSLSSTVIYVADDTPSNGEFTVRFGLGEQHQDITFNYNVFEDDPTPSEPPVDFEATASETTLTLNTGTSKTISMDFGGISLNEIAVTLTSAPASGQVIFNSTNGNIIFTGGDQTSSGQFSYMFSYQGVSQTITFDYQVVFVAALPPPSFTISATTTEISVNPEKSSSIALDIGIASIAELNVELTTPPEIGQVTFDTLSRSIIFIADERLGSGTFTLTFSFNGQSESITFNYSVAEPVSPPVAPTPVVFEVTVPLQKIVVYESSSQALPVSFNGINTSEVGKTMLTEPSIGSVIFDESTSSIVFTSDEQTGNGEFIYQFTYQGQAQDITFEYSVFPNIEPPTTPSVNLEVTATTTDISLEAGMSKSIPISIGEANMSDLEVSLSSLPLHGQAIFDSLTSNVIYVADAQASNGEFTLNFRLAEQQQEITFEYDVFVVDRTPVSPPPSLEVTPSSTSFTVVANASQSVTLNFGEVSLEDVDVVLTTPPNSGQVSFDRDTGSITFVGGGQASTGQFTYQFSSNGQTQSITFDYNVVVVATLPPPTSNMQVSVNSNTMVLAPSTTNSLAVEITGAEISDIEVELITPPVTGSVVFDAATSALVFTATESTGSGAFTFEFSELDRTQTITVNYEVEQADTDNFDIELFHENDDIQQNTTRIIDYSIVDGEGVNIEVDAQSNTNLVEVLVNNQSQKIELFAKEGFGSGEITVRASNTSSSETVEKTINLNVVDKKPTLAFSDLISGPGSGLGDNLGSGVIVTIWGYNLVQSDGNPSISICQSQVVCVPPAHVYYWKNADGQLPSGPADLYSSHGMQEIAISMPDLPNQESEIVFENDYGRSSLPFTFRDGAIYHIKSTGDDSSGDGSFNNPYRTIEKADAIARAGSTLYVHDVITGDESTVRPVYNNNLNAMSSLEAQFSYVAFPGNRPEVIGHLGFSAYAGGNDIIAGFVVSKFAVYAAEADEDENNQPIDNRAGTSWGIHGSQDGRAIGNFITDAHPDDLTGACPDGEHGAIVASAQNANGVSNYKVFGNHIKDYGCDGSSRFHHTTYFTIRSASADRQLVAPEIGYNFLENNKAYQGLHYFDENHAGFGEPCGQFTTTFKMHNNVIINQSGAALSFGAACPVNTSFEYYNNLIINSGLLADYSPEEVKVNVNTAVSISVSEPGVTSNLKFYDNMVLGWNAQGNSPHAIACLNVQARYDNFSIQWDSNICHSDEPSDFSFVKDNSNNILQKITGADNFWFSGSLNTGNNQGADLLAPIILDRSTFENPEVEIDGSKVLINANSPLLNTQVSNENGSAIDIYGATRNTNRTIGPIEFRPAN